MLATFFLKLMIWMLKGIFAGTHLRTRDVRGASDVADVRHDSVPQSGHSGGGLSHTKGDDGQPHYPYYYFDGEVSFGVKIHFCQCLGVF